MAWSPGWMNITSRIRSLAETLNSCFYKSSETLASVLPLNFSVGQLICKNMEENILRKKEKHFHLCPDFQKLLSIGLAFPGEFKCVFSVVLYKNILYQKLVLETFMVTFLQLLLFKIVSQKKGGRERDHWDIEFYCENINKLYNPVQLKMLLLNNK